ncbi:MAG: vitamin K epoxide reductase family protein [Verrucomicrobiota bacterium]|nr:vitamin K epoxide reductase family protein [Verrucomicrobiota bacterium]
MSIPKSSRNNLHKDHIPIGNWIQITRVLLISASIITAYLALLTLTQGGDVPGCGPDSDCDKVLKSPWAYWLGIPVSIPGLGLYLVFFLKTFGVKHNNLLPSNKKHIRSLNTLTLCAFGVIGAGIWFISIQALIIKAFCPYCCTAHALAMTASGLFLARAGIIAKRLNVKINITGGILTMATLIGIIGATQFLFPKQKPAPKIVELNNSKTNTVIQNNQTKITAKPNQNNTTANNLNNKEAPFPIPKTKLSLITPKLPIIGNRNAENRIAVLFDYTCHHCRTLHSYVRKIIPKYKNKLSCIMIPMPLDSKCNPRIKSTQKDHINACNYAKICLAVHQVSPGKYDEFDQWLFSNHNSAKTLSTVREHAEKIIGKKILDETINSQSVLDQLATNIEVYNLNSNNGGTTIMPQSIIKNRVMFGPPPSAETFEKILIQILDLK